jgi:hypothetical protein
MGLMDQILSRLFMGSISIIIHLIFVYVDIPGLSFLDVWCEDFVEVNMAYF